MAGRTYQLGKSATQLLFAASNGSPLRYSNWRRSVFDPAVKDCGWEGLTPHALRHTAASLAVSAEANAKAVQRMLSDKDAAMTLVTGAVLFEDDLDEVVSRVEEAVVRTVRTGERLDSLAIAPPIRVEAL